MDAGCFGATCTALKTQAFADANKCAVPDTVQETVDGCKSILPHARNIRNLPNSFSFRDLQASWIVGIPTAYYRTSGRMRAVPIKQLYI